MKYTYRKSLFTKEQSIQLNKNSLDIVDGNNQLNQQLNYQEIQTIRLGLHADQISKKTTPMHDFHKEIKNSHS